MQQRLKEGSGVYYRAEKERDIAEGSRGDARWHRLGVVASATAQQDARCS
jgi:hypothetical protein